METGRHGVVILLLMQEDYYTQLYCDGMRKLDWNVWCFCFM
jgi:hypothetical protein